MVCPTLELRAATLRLNASAVDNPGDYKHLRLREYWSVRRNAGNGGADGTVGRGKHRVEAL